MFMMEFRHDSNTQPVLNKCENLTTLTFSLFLTTLELKTIDSFYRGKLL